MARLRRATSSSSRRQVTARGGTCTGPATPTRPTAIVTDLVRATGADRGRQGQVDGHPGDRAQRGARRRPASPPYETDLAELIVQLGRRQAVAHPGAGDPPQPRRDPRDLPARDARRRPGPDRRAAARWPWPPGRTCARKFLARQGRDLRRQLRRRRDRHAGRRRVRGQRPDVPDPARDADHRDGHREARAHLARPRGVPAAAAPLLDRRADEPVHVDCGPASPPATGRRTFHLVLLDNGRTAALADPVGPRGAALHPLLGLPQRLPGLRAHRRARLRLGLPGPDRRRADARSSPGVRGQRRRCRTRRRCAAPASTPARSRSTSRRCWCTCAPQHVEARAARRRLPTPEALGDGRRRVGDGRPAAGSPPAEQAARRGRLLGRRRGRIRRCRRRCRRWTAQPRRCPARPPETFREWWAARTRGDRRVSARERGARPAIRRARSAPRRPTAPRSPATTGAPATHPPGAPELLELLADRLVDYRATVHRDAAADGVAGRRSPRRSPSAPAPVRRAARPARRLGAATARSPTTTRLAAGRAGRLRRRRHRLRRRVRRDRHDRPRRRARPGPPRHHPGARPCTSASSRADQVVQTVPEALARLDPDRPADLHQRAVGHQRHRAAAGSRASTARAP